MEAPPSRAPRAVLFDAYGTLFDVYSVGVVAERLFPGMGERLGVLWRDKQIEYTRLTSMSGQARSFRDCTRAGLRYAARRFDLALDDAAERELMGAYERLSPFAENHAVLVELRRRGVRTGILSNGDPDMLEAVVRHAGFAELLDPVLSVEGTGPVQDRSGDLRARHARARPATPTRCCSSRATAGTRSARPGSATRHSGSTASACPSTSSARVRRASARS